MFDIWWYIQRTLSWRWTLSENCQQNKINVQLKRELKELFPFLDSRGIYMCVEECEEYVKNISGPSVDAGPGLWEIPQALLLSWLQLVSSLILLGCRSHILPSWRSWENCPTDHMHRECALFSALVPTLWREQGTTVSCLHILWNLHTEQTTDTFTMTHTLGPHTRLACRLRLSGPFTKN